MAGAAPGWHRYPAHRRHAGWDGVDRPLAARRAHRGRVGERSQRTGVPARVRDGRVLRPPPSPGEWSGGAGLRLESL